MTPDYIMKTKGQEKKTSIQKLKIEFRHMTAIVSHLVTVTIMNRTDALIYSKRIVTPTTMLHVA